MKYTILDETWSDDSTLAVFVIKAEWVHSIYKLREEETFTFVVDDMAGGKFISRTGDIRHLTDDDDDAAFVEWLDTASDGPSR